MSSQRRAIMRLSFIMRLFLYVAMIGAVGFIGFGYTSGYVAIPGNTALAVPREGLPGAAPRVLVFRSDVVCNRTVRTTEDGKTMEVMSADCGDRPFFEMRAPGEGLAGSGTGKRTSVMSDGDLEVRIETTTSGTGDDAKTSGRLTVRKGEQVSKHDFEGASVPREVIDALPADIREKVREMIENAPEPPMPPPVPGDFVVPVPGSGDVMIPVPPGVAVPVPPPAGTTLPQAPDAPPGGTEGRGPSEERRIIFITPEGRGPFVPAPPMPPMPPAPLDVVTLSGPAIIHQQVEGFEAVRLALVGFMIALIVLAIIQLERLLAHFQNGELFSARNTSLLRNLGLLLIAITFVLTASTLMPAILAGMLHPTLVGALGPHVILLFAGGAVFLLAQVVAEAARLEDEAAHTV